MFGKKKVLAAPAAQAPESDGGGEQELVRAFMRATWYRDKYREGAISHLGLIGVLALSVSLNIIQFKTRPLPSAFAVTPDLRFMRLTPLSEESIAPGEIKQWAAQSVINAYTLDFRHLQDQLNSLEPQFTDAGYEGWLKSIGDTGLKKQILQYDYVVSAIVPEVPSIQKNFKVNGVRAWQITVPVTVTYQSGASATSQNLVVTLVAMRVPETRNGQGIAIHNFVAARRV